MSVKRTTACLVLGLAVLLPACPRPGEGATATQAYLDCEPIEKALERHKVDHGDYPATLKDLVPAYLGSVPTAAGAVPDYRKPAAGTYELMFTYTGPGMNHCLKQPGLPWKCRGYY